LVSEKSADPTSGSEGQTGALSFHSVIRSQTSCSGKPERTAQSLRKKPSDTEAEGAQYEPNSWSVVADGRKNGGAPNLVQDGLYCCGAWHLGEQRAARPSEDVLTIEKRGQERVPGKAVIFQARRDR